MKSDTRLLSIGAVLVSLLAILHTGALLHKWYFFYPWFDVPMHLLGGAWIALTAYWFLYVRDGSFERVTRGRKIFFVTAIVCGVSVLWEAFEVFAGMPMLDNYVSDTVLDIVMGVLGGLVGIWYAMRRYPSENI